MKQRAEQRYKGAKRRRLDSKKTEAQNVEGSPEEILTIETRDLLHRHRSKTGTGDNSDDARSSSVREDRVSPAAEPGQELELHITELSSTGDGLALSDDGTQVFVVPFAIPGDVVKAKTWYRNNKPYNMTDFVEVVKASPQRDDSLIQCKYFAKCGGCQFQMLPYQKQLAHKKRIVENAFKYFSGLSPHHIPPVEETMGSPLQYSYRTKLQPHFSLRGPTKVVPPIGYLKKNTKQVMDIESCPIGADILQEGLTSERARVAKTIEKFKNGATILLRESTERIPNPSLATTPDSSMSNTHTPPTKELTTTESGAPLLKFHHPTYTDHKTCITDMTGNTTEIIGPANPTASEKSYTFTSRAGSFFQNNNSILHPFTNYIRSRLFPPIIIPHHPDPNQRSPTSKPTPPIKYLLDAYCGSGLFSITLSTHFLSVLGIDIDQHSISAARANATANGITNAGFIAADATALFADVPFPSDQTMVVIDPPRKGASEDFLRQLLHFGPKRVVYVSCNVHTQARDVGRLVAGFPGGGGAAKKDGETEGEREKQWRYEIESLKGFDFFPQTGHVEGVAFLNRVEDS